MSKDIIETANTNDVPKSGWSIIKPNAAPNGQNSLTAKLFDAISDVLNKRIVGIHINTEKNNIIIHLKKIIPIFFIFEFIK